MTTRERLCHDHVMRSWLRRVWTVLLGRPTRLRWAYLILGGAVLMPYFFVTLTAAQLLDEDTVTTTLPLQFVAFAAALPLVALTAFFPAVRTLEVAAARVMLGGAAADLVPGPPTSPSARYRAALWYVLHLAGGGVVSGMTLAVPPAALLFVLPFLGRNLDVLSGVWPTWAPLAWAPLVGLGMLVGLAAVAAGFGALLARLAPVLLGPSPADRLAALERRAAGLAERNRLARELHDSVGHALSVVTIQAGAAGRLLETDPDFVRRALSAIEESTRSALTDLDHVLGLLREEPASTRPQPLLTDLDRLLARSRDAGVEVEAEVAGDPARLPPALSREAYRIVQEGLTNALRHAGAVPVRLRVDVRKDRLTLELTNPFGPDRHDDRGGRDGTPDGRVRGGRGLPGIAERVAILGGDVTAGADDHQWRIFVEVPL